MAVTATLVCARPNRQRWLLVQDGNEGASVVLTTTGQVSNDILTASAAAPGRIRQIAKARTQGYGQFVAGALTQAQARALWLADRSGANPGSIERIQVARCETTPRDGATNPIWIVDAGVDGSGNPTLTIGCPLVASSAYLDIEVEGGGIGA